jgi:hypothetical protein
MPFILEVIYYLKPSIQMENPMITDIKSKIRDVNPDEIRDKCSACYLTTQNIIKYLIKDKTISTTAVKEEESDIEFDIESCKKKVTAIYHGTSEIHIEELETGEFQELLKLTDIPLKQNCKSDIFKIIKEESKSFKFQYGLVLVTYYKKKTKKEPGIKPFSDLHIINYFKFKDQLIFIDSSINKIYTSVDELPKVYYEQMFYYPEESICYPPEVKSEPQSENSNPLKRKHPEEKKTKKEPIKKHKSTDTINDKKWNENFEEVRRFHEKHGRWPKQSEGALGRWCSTQRQTKKGKGAGTRIAKLDGIGFDWGTTMTGTPEQRWNENFEEVRRFHKKHGRWPKRSEGVLRRWCDNQRQSKKGQGHQRISLAQIAKLDGIGFDWGTTMAGTPEERWDVNFEEVRRFRVEHGRWPTPKREGALGMWCDRQRQAKKGQGRNRISQERIAKLYKIGFDWGSAMTDVSA